MEHYDYIICGAGCAGLMLALEMINSPLNGRAVLLIDQNQNSCETKTWCYWSNKSENYPAIVKKTWSNLVIRDHKEEIPLNLGAYRYSMISGKDFSDYAKQEIDKVDHMDFVNAKVISIKENNNKVVIDTTQGAFTSDYAFNGIYDTNKVISTAKINFLYQKFLGICIKTPNPDFNPEQAIFMDFRLAQETCTTFGCFLPVSSTEAFVEVVCMSENGTNNHLQEKLKKYLDLHLNLSNYQISYKETGFIPMTNYNFPSRTVDRIIHIGTAAGRVKASTGYAFMNQQVHAKAIVKAIIDSGHPYSSTPFISRRHHLYDSTLLNILKDKPGYGKMFFIRLFRKNSAHRLFKFLDEGTTIPQELYIFSTVNIILFIKWILISLMQWINRNL